MTLARHTLRLLHMNDANDTRPAAKLTKFGIRFAGGTFYTVDSGEPGINRSPNMKIARLWWTRAEAAEVAAQVRGEVFEHTF